MGAYLQAEHVMSDMCDYWPIVVGHWDSHSAHSLAD